MIDCFNTKKSVIKSKSNVIFYSVLDIRCHFLIWLANKIENKNDEQNRL